MKNKRAFAITIAALVALISLSCAAAPRPPKPTSQKAFSYKSMPEFQRKMSKEAQIKMLEDRITTWKKQIERHQDSIKRLKIRIRETEKQIKDLKKRK